MSKVQIHSKRASTRVDARGAVDATIEIDGVVGDVTLHRDTGDLDIWGDSIDCWASPKIVKVLCTFDFPARDDLIATIVAVVRKG